MKPNVREPLAAQARSFVHANPIKSRFEVSVSKSDFGLSQMASDWICECKGLNQCALRLFASKETCGTQGNISPSSQQNRANT